jgi:hypothetical protein
MGFTLTAICAIQRERQHHSASLDRGWPVTVPVQPQGGIEYAEVGRHRREI